MRLADWGKRVKSRLFPPRIGVSSKPYVHSSLLKTAGRLILSKFAFWLRRQNRINVLHGWRHVKNRSGPLQHVPLLFKPLRLINRSNSISNFPELEHNYKEKTKSLSSTAKILSKVLLEYEGRQGRRCQISSWSSRMKRITIPFLSFPYIPMLTAFFHHSFRWTNRKKLAPFSLSSLFSRSTSSDWRLSVN